MASKVKKYLFDSLPPDIQEDIVEKYKRENQDQLLNAAYECIDSDIDTIAEEKILELNQEYNKRGVLIELNGEIYFSLYENEYTVDELENFRIERELEGELYEGIKAAFENGGYRSKCVLGLIDVMLDIKYKGCNNIFDIFDKDLLDDYDAIIQVDELKAVIDNCEENINYIFTITLLESPCL